MYDLEGSDSAREWIELLNTSTSVDLTNWRFEESGTQHALTLKQGSAVVSSGQYVIVVDDYTQFLQDYPGFSGTVFDSSFSLLNSGENLKLRDALNGNIIDEVTYTSSLGGSGDGNSLQRNSNDSWIASVPTPNTQNISTPYPTSTPTPSPASPPTPTPSSAPQTTSSFTISNIPNIPSQINSDQSFSVDIVLSIPNSQNTDYYLKGAFKKSDGTRYFGLTKKDSDWIEYGDKYSDQYKITTGSTGNWNGSIEVKPDTLDNDYKESGDYTFKVGRFTATGSGPVWSDKEATIKINAVESVPSDSPSPQATPEISPSASVFTTNSQSSALKPAPSIKNSYRIASVAGTQTATPEGKVEVKNQKQQINPFIWIGLFFIFAGTGLIGYSYLKKNEKIHFPFRR